MCCFKLMAFACFVAAVSPVTMAGASPDLPAGVNPAEDVGNYTVLYDGPDGSHLQTGEPGKAVKGFYTFFDSRGRKQKVTYEADARGYRVTSNAAVAAASGHIPVTTRRPRIIEKVLPKLQAGVLFTKKINEARSEFREQSTIHTTDQPQLTISKTVPNSFTTEQPFSTSTLKNFGKEIIRMNSVSTGQIKFKEPKALLNYDFAYNLGYPFVAGIYVYAL